MAIDIRATVTCSLGTLISASVSDDYVQGTGLIKTKGSCELSGIVTPSIGTAVTFSYTQDGVTRQVPRKLRVLSSFADPFRRTTKVELGCKLTYLQDLQEPVDWTAYDDEDNAGLTEADAQIITIPIRAKSVMNKCLTELGITASSNPLTNKFSIEKFDLGAGYVSVLSDLLVSESYCGYLNTSEVLQVFSLDQKGGTGPVIDSTKLIDLGSIGVGQLPGEAVVVSYSSLKLNAGIEDPNAADWDTVTASKEHTVTIPYTDTAGTQQFKQYSVLDTDLVSTTYQQIVKPSGEVVKVPLSRRSIATTGSVRLVGSLVTDYLKNGMSYFNQEITTDTSEFFYYDDWGNETLYIKDTRGSQAHLAGDLGIQQWVFTPNSDYVQLSTTTDRSIDYQIRRTTTVGEFQRVVTETYGSWTRTIPGQQAVAAGVQDLTTSSQVNQLLTTLFPTSGGLGNKGLFLLDTEVSTQRRTEGQIAPDGSSTINAANANGGDPSNGYKTESKESLELALGSATAQRRIEFTMPKAPDDVFTRAGTAPNYTYSSEASDAPAKARRYGRSQNRLLLGNRSGMNVQMAAPLMPAAPFAPFVVQANGLSALYRTNGTSWQMDASGILASTDALFWGAVGGTGTFWFPVAPGITTLPTAPAVVDGEMTVTSTVPTWNETVVAVAKTSTKLEVTSLPYALSLLTQVAVTTRTALAVTRILKVEVPAADVNVAGVAPAVSIGVALRSPAADVAVAGAAPAVSTATVVQVPAADVAVAGAAPSVSASLTVVLVPVADITVAGATPDLQAGDDYYTNLATQFWTLLRDWRVDWWGD
jgi:hypothetical protein